MEVESPISSRVHANGRVFVVPTSETRETAILLDNAAYAQLQAPASTGFSVSEIIDYAAAKTNSLTSDFCFRFAGENKFLIIFPEKWLREIFVSEHADSIIDLNMYFLLLKVWISVYNMPEHHYNAEKATELVSGFGRLVRADMERAKVDCSDEVGVTKKIEYFHDNFFMREVSLDVELEMGILMYGRLGLDSVGLSYVDAFERAKKAMSCTTGVFERREFNWKLWL